MKNGNKFSIAKVTPLENKTIIALMKNNYLPLSEENAKKFTVSITVIDGRPEFGRNKSRRARGISKKYQDLLDKARDLYGATFDDGALYFENLRKYFMPKNINVIISVTPKKLKENEKEEAVVIAALTMCMKDHFMVMSFIAVRDLSLIHI